jgi:hypothetical protein
MISFPWTDEVFESLNPGPSGIPTVDWFDPQAWRVVIVSSRAAGANPVF